VVLSLVGLIAGGCALDEGEVDVTCKLSAKALSKVVGEIRGGEDLGIILGVLEPGVARLCEDVINHFIERPDTPIGFVLHTPTGPILQIASLEELATPPETAQPDPPISPEELQRTIDCVRGLDLGGPLLTPCVDGTIEP